MKKNLTAMFLLFLIHSQAQKIEKYYDYRWQLCEPSDARFYSSTEKTDSGWLRKDYFLSQRRLQMMGLYKDSGAKYAIGQFYYYYPGGSLKMKGRYTENKKQGLWLEFYDNFFIKDSTVYDYGEAKGASMKWHRNGYLSDSIVYKDDGTAIVYQWFDDGTMAAAGRLNIVNLHTGKWQFFHHNGQLSAKETYENGKLIDKIYYAENGEPMADQSDKTCAAEFPGGVKKWMSYLERNLYFPHGYVISNGDTAPMVVEFTIDENGKVVDISIEAPFHEALDAAVREILTNSPDWNAAISHNRKIRYTHRQSVTFRDR
jgi:hypothetical protein